MTDKPMAFAGTLGHVKFIQGRKVAQFIVEVPTEQAMTALQMLGGIPRPDEPFHVAVARIDKHVASDGNEAERDASSFDERKAAENAVNLIRAG